MKILKRLFGIHQGPKINNSSEWNKDVVGRKVRFISKHIPLSSIIEIWNVEGEEGINKLLMKYRPRPNTFVPPLTR